MCLYDQSIFGCVLVGIISFAIMTIVEVNGMDIQVT